MVLILLDDGCSLCVTREVWRLKCEFVRPCSRCVMRLIWTHPCGYKDGCFVSNHLPRASLSGVRHWLQFCRERMPYVCALNPPVLFESLRRWLGRWDLALPTSDPSIFVSKCPPKPPFLSCPSALTGRKESKTVKE